MVQGVEAVWMGCDEGGEEGGGFFEVLCVVVQEGALGEEEDGSGEDEFEVGEGGEGFGRVLVEFLVGVEEEKEGHDVLGELGLDAVELARLLVKNDRLDGIGGRTSSRLLRMSFSSCHAPQ